MNVFRFRRVFRAIFFGAGPAAAMLACTGELDPTPMPERALCTDPSAADRYKALSIGGDVDGVALASRGARSPEVSRLPSLGTPCARATDKAACERTISELLANPVSSGWFPGQGSYGVDYGVITSGDRVALATVEQFRAAVAPIDSREEAAALLVVTGGGAFDCDDNNVRSEPDGWVFRQTSSSCSGEKVEYFAKVTRGGEIVPAGKRTLREADQDCIEGRRPLGLVAAASAESWLASTASCLAEIAHMEMAAVLAFDDLVAQLDALGAPPELVARARRAKREEIGHAKLATKLARRFGAEPRRPKVDGTKRDPFAADAAFALAMENATEGCVREAYGALVAAFQAAHAADPSIRSAFARIAREEAAHAELSFAIDAWLAHRLSPAERAAVADAKAEAWTSLAISCEADVAPEVARTCGMPRPEEARQLLAALEPAFASAA